MSYLKKIQRNNQLAPNVVERHHITRENDGLEYIELKQLVFEKGGEYSESLTDLEVCLVILTGKVTVLTEEETFEQIGTREDVFDKIPTDSIYLSSGKTFKIISESSAKVLLCYAPSSKDLPTKFISAKDNLVEHRGKYQNKRMVHNILDDKSLISDKLIVVEVFTNGGNWSSYPPHKHDQNNLPEESFLEETYYHEMNPKQGFIFQRVYTDDLSIDETMTVENENVVLVPKGYHPVSVPDGYDSYYLNIMAGPIKKWQFNNDKNHEWIINRT
ncbi:MULTISPECIES: 5-deoxy-glucuronate isomerase [Vagococcus]|uniref:5-deoxy-glucuronate isomerase n=1 Tax=Vagococcus TaxID=2737 RepID=UPI002FC7FABE